MVKHTLSAYGLTLWSSLILCNATPLSISRLDDNDVRNTSHSLHNTETYVRNIQHANLVQRNTDAVLKDRPYDGLDDFCDDDPFFMAMTPENLREAKPGKFYREFLDVVKTKYPQPYESLSGPQLLGKFGWHDPNFNCDMQLPGCVPVPTCRDLVRGIRKARLQAHEDVAEGLVNVTRQEFFAARSIDEMARFFNSLDKLLDKTLTHIGLRIEETVSDFTPKIPSAADADLFCKVTQEVIDLGYNLIIAGLLAEGMGAGIGAKGGAISGWGPIQALMAASKSAKKMGEMGFERIVEDAHDKHIANGEKGVGSRWFRLSQEYTTGKCAAFYQDYAIDEAARGTKLKVHLAQEFLNFTEVVHDTWDLLVKRPHSTEIEFDNSTEAQFGDMGSWIDYGQWHDLWEVMLGKYSGFLENMVKAVQDNVLSTIWRSDRCSVKCRTWDKHAHKLCGADKDKTKHGQSRYCPDDSTICQVQCHTVKRFDNEERFLFGWGNLQKHGLTAETVVRKSWEQRGAMGPPTKQSVLDLMQQIANYQRSFVALPVCSSPYTAITSFKNRKLPISKLLHRNTDQAMACYCGDWRGNETRLYMEALGLHPQSPDWLSHKAKEQMEVICPHNLRKLPPANHFLAFCELGVRFPKPGEPTKVRMEEHPLCGTIRERLATMTEAKANHYFCNEMPERKDIFRHELPRVDIFPPLENHEGLCRGYNYATRGLGYKVEDFSHLDWRPF